VPSYSWIEHAVVVVGEWIVGLVFVYSVSLDEKFLGPAPDASARAAKPAAGRRGSSGMI